MVLAVRRARRQGGSQIVDSSTPPALLSLLAGLWRHLPARRRGQFLLLLGLMLVSALAEVVSIGAILPFLAVLTAPERVFSYSLAAALAGYFGITQPEQLVLPFTVVFAAVALGAGLIRIVLLWVSTRLTAASGSELSIEVYRRTLYQPYLVHISRNSSDVINGITNKVNGVVFGIILPLLALVSSSLALVAITLALLAIDPLVASLAAFGFGLVYLVITLAYRRRLHRNSARIVIEQTQVLKALQEGLGGIRDVLLDGNQPVYCDVYRKADLPFRRAQGDNSFVGQGPRYAIEAVGMVLITALAFVLSRKAGGIAAALPMLGALALGAQRLLPALQQIYNAWTSRTPVIVMGGTGPMDTTRRRPWIDWIHTAQVQAQLVRDYVKWDDQPQGAASVAESILRAYQIAMTDPKGPVYLCLDVELQESPLPADFQLPEPARYRPPAPPAGNVEDIAAADAPRTR